MMRRLQFMLLVSLCCGALGVVAAQALAGTTHFCASTSISPGDACADGNTHSGSFYVEATLDHTGCAAYNSGHGGVYTANSGGTTDTWTIACTVGSGTNGGYTGSGVMNVHATVWNQNLMTTDVISDAHTTW